MVSVRQLTTDTRRDGSPAALAEARANAVAGDASWQRRVHEYERGEAVILQLDLVLELMGDDHGLLQTSAQGVFFELHADPSALETQIAAVLAQALVAWANEVMRAGYDIDLPGLGQTYVQVELDYALRRHLNHVARAGPPARLILSAWAYRRPEDAPAFGRRARLAA